MKLIRLYKISPQALYRETGSASYHLIAIMAAYLDCCSIQEIHLPFGAAPLDCVFHTIIEVYP